MYTECLCRPNTANLVAGRSMQANGGSASVKRNHIAYLFSKSRGHLKRDCTARNESRAVSGGDKKSRKSAIQDGVFSTRPPKTENKDTVSCNGPTTTGGKTSHCGRATPRPPAQEISLRPSLLKPWETSSTGNLSDKSSNPMDVGLFAPTSEPVASFDCSGLFGPFVGVGGEELGGCPSD